MEPPTWAGGSGDNSTRKLALQIFEELRKVGKRHERSAGLLMSPADVLRFTFATRWASTGWLSAASHLAAAAPYSVLSLLSVVPLEDSDKSTNWIWHLAFLLLPAGSMCCTVLLAWTVTSSCATSASWQTQTEASLATCSCLDGEPAQHLRHALSQPDHRLQGPCLPNMHLKRDMSLLLRQEGLLHLWLCSVARVC